MRRLHTPDDLEGIADAALRRVIRQRFTELAAYDDYTFDELAEFWLVEPGEAPLTLVDRSTGEAITPVVCDLDSGEPLDPRRVRWELEAAPQVVAP